MTITLTVAWLYSISVNLFQSAMHPVLTMPRLSERLTIQIRQRRRFASQQLNCESKTSFVVSTLRSKSTIEKLSPDIAWDMKKFTADRKEFW